MIDNKVKELRARVPVTEGYTAPAVYEAELQNGEVMIISKRTFDYWTDIIESGGHPASNVVQ